MKFNRGPLFPGTVSLDIDNVKALLVFFIAEIEAFQAAAVNHRRIIVEDLAVVDVTQGDIIESGIGDVLSIKCAPCRWSSFFRAGFGATTQMWAERTAGKAGSSLAARVLMILVRASCMCWLSCLEIEVFGVLFTEQGAAPQPGEGHNLDDAVFGLESVNLRFIGDDDIFHGQRIEDFGAGGGVRQRWAVVVADEQEDQGCRRGKPVIRWRIPLLVWLGSRFYRRRRKTAPGRCRCSEHNR